MFEYLWTHGKGVIDNDTVWFVPANFNFLCQYNYMHNVIKRFIHLHSSISMEGSHYNILKVEQKIILIPTRDINIFVFDIMTEKLECFPFGGERDLNERCMEYAIWKEYIYIFPITYPYIVKFNYNNFSIEYIKSKSVNKCIEKKVPYTDSCVQNNDTVNILIYNSNKICEFNLETYEERSFTIGNKEQHYRTICNYKKNGLILSDQKGNVTILDDKKRIVQFMKASYEVKYRSCIPVSEGFLFIPYDKTNRGFLWKEKEKIFFCIDKIRQTSWVKKWEYSAYSVAYYDEYKAMFFNVLMKSLCILNLRTYNVNQYYIELKVFSEKLLEKIFCEYDKWNVSIVNEFEIMDIQGYLRYICYMKSRDIEKSKRVGNEIYQNLSLK